MVGSRAGATSLATRASSRTGGARLVQAGRGVPAGVPDVVLGRARPPAGDVDPRAPVDRAVRALQLPVEPADDVPLPAEQSFGRGRHLRLTASRPLPPVPAWPRAPARRCREGLVGARGLSLGRVALRLNVAARYGATALCLGLALAGRHQAPLLAYRQPELALLALFYLALLPSAFLNLLWLPHQLLERRRSELLKPVARAFDDAVAGARPSRGDGAARLRAKADCLSEVARQLKVLDEAWPVWPLRTRRLGPVVVTAVLPVVVPLLSTALSKLLNG